MNAPGVDTSRSPQHKAQALRPQPQAQSQAHDQAQPRPQDQSPAQPQAHDQPQAQAQAQDQPQTQAASQPEARPQAQVQAQPQAQAQPQTQAGPQHEAQPQTQPQPEPHSQHNAADEASTRKPQRPRKSRTPRRQHRQTTPQAAKPAPVRARRPRRPWAKAKAVGATFAIGVLVTGAALPALGHTGEQAAATALVSTLADGDAQTYTAKDAIRSEIAPRESFSATTPEEIKETRSRAAAAAVAAGMPLGSAIDIPVADRIVMPMADGTYSFTDGFGASRPGRSHLGQDFAAGIGTPINAAMKGCVSRSTESYQGYGVTIQIESIVDGQAVSTVYSHMTYGSRAVEVGDCVDAGQYIGDVGSTGYVFGSCLHFEVHINTVPVDPLPWLQKNVS